MPRHTAQPIKLALLASTVAALSIGCVLDLDKLDAGQDDDSNDETIDPNDPDNALECLIGSEVDTTGVEQTSWTPQCTSGVVCADGWGHDGDALPIAWTTQMPVFPPDSPHEARAIGVFENGRIVVAVERPGAIGFEHFEPDGVNFGGYDVEGIGSMVYQVEIDSQVAYVTHGNDDGTINLSAIQIDSQQMLWTTSFPAYWATALTRNGGRIALVLLPDDEASAYELVILDLDGNVQWQGPTVDAANAVALSPSGARVAVAGDSTRVYATADGSLLDEFVHGSLFTIRPQDSTFLDEDRLVTIGTGVEFERLNGWLAGDSLTGDLQWEQAYNRATSWCPDEEDDQFTAETTEILGEVTELSDGSLVVVGSENFESGGVYGSHPWVARFAADGEFLASDRGLWDGYAIDTVAGSDGSVFVLIADGLVTACEHPCDLASQPYMVRKYIP